MAQMSVLKKISHGFVLPIGSLLKWLNLYKAMMLFLTLKCAYVTYHFACI